MNKYFLFLFFSCLASGFAYSQSSFHYVHLKDDSLQLLSNKKAIYQQFQKDSTTETGENKKYVIKIYRERYEALNDMFREKQILFNEPSNSYLQSLAREVVEKNPVLKNMNLRILFSKADWPNAASYGEGTIIFNIGLFSKLQNESEVVFVLSHELAHYYLDHAGKHIHQYVNTVYSDDFQKKLKEIKKSEFEQNKQLIELMKGFTFRTRRHGREHESEADSMALVFMQHTQYDVNQALSALGLLDDIDKDTYDSEKGLKQHFSFAAYPFKKSWTSTGDDFFGGVKKDQDEKKIEDSLKTHPDCKVRVEKLRPLVQQFAKAGLKPYLVSEATFNQLKTTFQYDIVEYCFQSDRVSRCLYYAMELYDKHPDDAYLAMMIGKCFNTFYAHQKKHTLSTIVDLPSPQVEKNYNVLLSFIQNINMNDMAALGHYFLLQHQSAFGSDEKYTAELTISNQNFK